MKWMTSVSESIESTTLKVSRTVSHFWRESASKIWSKHSLTGTPSNTAHALNKTTGLFSGYGERLNNF